MLRLFGIYAAALMLGTVIITFNNVFINGISLKELWEFNIKAVLIGDLLILLLLQTAAFVRLRDVFPANIPGLEADSKRREEILQRLQRFPESNFRWLTVIAVIFSLLYHTADAIFYGTVPDQEYLLGVAGNFSVEMALALTLAVLFYTLIRRALQPIILQLHVTRLSSASRDTLMKPLILTLSSCFLITIINVLRFLLNANAGDIPLDFTVLAGVVGFYILFGVGMFLLTALELRRDLRRMIESIRTLKISYGQKPAGKLPVLSGDELGRLTSSFNDLQEAVRKAYEEVENDLQLAFSVQQKLLSEIRTELGEFQVASASFAVQAAGGSFYDAAPCTQDRIAVMIGKVSAERMPGALLMSAVLVQFRAEIRYGGAPVEILKRLNLQLAKVIPEEMKISFGLAIFDPDQAVVRYAGAGHAAFYQLQGEAAKRLGGPTLPLGSTLAAEFEENVIPIGPDDHWLLTVGGPEAGVYPFPSRSSMDVPTVSIHRRKRDSLVSGL